jgi:thiamine kinase-like enzyme
MLPNAARLLADMRSISAERLRVGVLAPEVRAAYYQPAERYAGCVSRLLNSASLESSQRLTLRQILDRLPDYVERLYETAAAALTHNDYNAKNLVVKDTGVVAIDWSHAELSPHLGDLYCLLRDAQAHGAAAADVTDAYLTRQTDSDIAWHIQMGGLCWMIRGLHWVWAVNRDNRNREHLTDLFIQGAAECLNNLEAF